ncbi:hypothetical protein RvY_02674-2 [Ramazzottius varieornatus]|uniref:G-protein coupled receptors family 1 profile domain-containing protein n=1 Tax=Ramazzottius varieornatus TaxID=947166 RepID=A0A1D1UKJ1_RAMVA|nr:hypothetical protein RvY_02674-2 [Ramazzottius varieornatus]
MDLAAMHFRNQTDIYSEITGIKSQNPPNISDLHLYIWTSLILSIFTCGSFGNALTIISIFTTKKLRTHSNLLVMNMAVVDLLLSGIIYPMKVIIMLVHRSSSDDIPHSLCHYYGFLSVALTFSSNMTSMSIALNRFCAIVYANKYYNLQRLPVLLLMILIPWIVPPAISALGLMQRFANESFALTEIGFCTFNLDLHNEEDNHFGFMMAVGIPGLFIPTIVIAVSYIAVYAKVRRVRQNLRRSIYCPLKKSTDAELPTAEASGFCMPLIIRRFEHRVRGARMMFICFSAFCITYYPAFIILSVAHELRSNILIEQPPLLLWFFGLYFTGCCANPVGEMSKRLHAT